jgi:hypothetical protein
MQNIPMNTNPAIPNVINQQILPNTPKTVLKGKVPPEKLVKANAAVNKFLSSFVDHVSGVLCNAMNLLIL